MEKEENIDKSSQNLKEDDTNEQESQVLKIRLKLKQKKNQKYHQNKKF